MKSKILIAITASLAVLGAVSIITRNNLLAVCYIVLSVLLLTAVSIGGSIEIRSKKKSTSLKSVNVFGGGGV
jgi:hypothetical protein